MHEGMSVTQRGPQRWHADCPGCDYHSTRRSFQFQAVEALKHHVAKVDAARRANGTVVPRGGTFTYAVHRLAAEVAGAPSDDDGVPSV